MSTKIVRSPEPASWMTPSERTWRAPCDLEILCWSRYVCFYPSTSTCSVSLKPFNTHSEVLVYCQYLIISNCVQKDVESYDPILNPVLNREVRRTGGRVLITLGDQDIDLSPSFVIFLSTRDPTVSCEICRGRIRF